MSREMSIDLKRTLFDKELMYIYKEYVKKNKNKKGQPEATDAE